MGFKFIRADPSHEAGILALAQRSLGWGDDPRYRDFYRWKHDENPFGPSPRWVALDGERIVGFRVFLRWRFRRGSDTVSAVRAVDTATDPDFQGRGIFRSLTLAALDELREEGVGFVFNTPNEQSRPGYLKMGWIDLGRPPVAMAPRLRSMITIAQARTSAQRWSEETDAGTDAARALEGDGAEKLADLAGSTGTWSTDLTSAVLRWRYSFGPLRYRVLTAGPDGGTAAIFRVRRRGAARETTVAEVFAPENRLRRRVVRRALRETGADYALVASRHAVDAVPAITVPAFSPRVTWRRVTCPASPSLDKYSFSVGDLELF